MDAKLPPGPGIVVLLAVATAFAANHVAARAAGTALVLLLLMRFQQVAISLPRELRGQAVLAGVLVAVQSYCLYSAVAVIPAALALLVFQTCPMLYVLLS